MTMTAPTYKPLYNSSWAVLVGINEYSDSSIPDLRGPVADAETLRKVLITTYDFPEHQYFLTYRLFGN